MLQIVRYNEGPDALIAEGATVFLRFAADAVTVLGETGARSRVSEPGGRCRRPFPVGRSGLPALLLLVGLSLAAASGAQRRSAARGYAAWPTPMPHPECAMAWGVVRGADEGGNGRRGAHCHASGVLSMARRHRRRSLHAAQAAVAGSDAK